MPVTLVIVMPRNPADSWGIANPDGTEAERRSETARHAAPLQKAGADNLADRCRLRNQMSETARHAVSAHSAAADSLADRCRSRNKTSETARHAAPAHDARRRALEGSKSLQSSRSFRMSFASEAPSGVVVPTLGCSGRSHRPGTAHAM